MKRFLIFIPLLLCTRIGVAQQSVGDRCFADSGRALRQQLPALIDSAMIPGLALAILDRGEIVWSGGFGERDTKGGKVSANHTVFEAASLSKPVVAYATLKLVDAGRLDLDKPLVNYASYPELGADARGQTVTARMVLSHTTGLQNERHGPTDSLRFSFDPGTRFQYSGEGYALLGKAIEAITGQSLAAAIDSLVFNPLGMTRSSFVWASRFADDAAIGRGPFGETRQPTRPTVARAPSSLQTTAVDYARFLAAVVDTVGLHPLTWQLMMTPAVEAAPNVSWGLGWAIEKDSLDYRIAHHGDNSNSGFTAFTMIDIPRQCGFVYLTNSNNGLSIAREVAALVPGNHPALALLNYPRYNSPYFVARARVARVVKARGIDAALAEYRQLADSDSTATPESLLNDLGYYLLDQLRIEDAIRAFRANIAAYPRSPDVYEAIGDAYLAGGHRTAARDGYRRATELDSTKTRARRLADSLNA
ncbi:MAG TPA: serine hydrolase, partial [Gemmatimonadaceae bacterium]|nr:serine hydrolase [Gemmatimonadaceae bacterium]